MAGSLPSKGRISLPARRLSVRKIKEVLRLKFEVGLGLRQIARSCSIGLGTAHEYLERAEAAKITWPLGRSGMMTGLRPRCSADRPAVGQRCCPCLTLLSFTASASSIRM